jgi:glycosyltransferase involved in cell wall biosynthesis
MSERDRIELSVLIASHNRKELLQRCLDSLAAQTQPASFEVIVADDGSDDGTAEMVDGLQMPYRLRALRLAKGGKSATLNAAIDTAAGDVCVFLDDDVIASPELVAAYLEAHRDESLLGVGAIVQRPPDARDWYAQAFAKAWGEHSEELARRPARWTDCYGANFSAPRSALLGIGGFTEGLKIAEDFDVALRLCRAGCVPKYVPRAEVVHDDQKRCGRMLADAYGQGIVHVELAERFPETRDDLLDWHSGAGPNELAVRRLCVALHVPPRALAWLGRFVPGEGRKMIWLHFVRRVAFWGGVRRRAGRAEWARLTSGRDKSPPTAIASPIALILADIVPHAPL